MAHVALSCARSWNPMMQGFHHPKGRQQPFLHGLALLYN